MRAFLLAAGLVAAASGNAMAGDAAKGENVFKKCVSCHMVGPDAKIKTGPVLNGIFGKAPGSQADYAAKYSKGLVALGAGGAVWNAELLGKYLENPKGVVEDSKMSFAGLKKPEERDDVIAYLLQFSPDYKP